MLNLQGHFMKDKAFKMKKTALISGASSGIGRATARLFAKNGIRLILCGRRADRLQALQEELSEVTDVCTLVFDIRDREATAKALQSRPAAFENIDILINNAGNAHGLDLIHEGRIEDWEAMIDINIKGLLYLSRALLPAMVARGRGHVVNIGSIAGKEAYPRGNVYVATKFAVDGLTRAMRQDLLGTGVRVSAVHPGLVHTEFSEVRFKGDHEKAEAVYEGYRPLEAVDVADSIWYIVSRPDHVNVADLLILPSDQASATLVDKKTET